MKVLFLDDCLQRHREFKRNNIGTIIDAVYTAQEAIEKLKSSSGYDMIYLDHDLDDRFNNTIMENIEDGRFVVSKMIQEPLLSKWKDTPVIVHSLNEQAGNIMRISLLRSGYEDVRYIPFIWKMKRE